MKAFVTGGSGFLGLNVIMLLQQQGWQVTAMHRKNADISDLKKLNVTLVEGHLEDKSLLKEIMPSDLDAVFHIAADTNMWTKNNQRQYQTNVVGTQNLVDVAIENKVSRFIHTSSISAYGFHEKTITETDKSTAMQSNVNYLKTKYLGEKVVKDAVKQRGLDAVILNPCAIIGAHDKHNWSQLFTMVNTGSLPGVPPGEGSYCHVKQVALAHLAAYTKGRTGENYILAGTNCAFSQVVEKIGKLLGKPTPKKPVSQWILKLVGYTSYWVSLITNKEPTMTPEKALMVSKRVVAISTKAVKGLDYNDNISIDVMLNDCYQWMKSENRL